MTSIRRTAKGLSFFFVVRRRSKAYWSLPIACLLCSQSLVAQSDSPPTSVVPPPTIVETATPFSSSTVILRDRLVPPPPSTLPRIEIETSKLPHDVLNCEECRRRLGLPPLASVSTTSSPIDSPKQETVKAQVLGEPSPSPSNSEKLSGRTEREGLAERPPALMPPDESGDVRLSASESAEAEPTPKWLGGSPNEVAQEKFSPPEADERRVEGILVSPAAQKIQIDLLKKQLAERDEQLAIFASMQATIEERIDQLASLNANMAKRESDHQAEIEQSKKASERALQNRDLEIANLRAELASVRADGREQAKQFSDQRIAAEKAKAEELARLSDELLEAKQSRNEALGKLRKELAELREKATSNFDSNGEAESQAKAIESLEAEVRSLKATVAESQKTQLQDVKTIAMLQKEIENARSEQAQLALALAKQQERTKQLESAQQTELAKQQELVKQLELARQQVTQLLEATKEAKPTLAASPESPRTVLALKPEERILPPTLNKARRIGDMAREAKWQSLAPTKAIPLDETGKANPSEKDRRSF